MIPEYLAACTVKQKAWDTRHSETYIGWKGACKRCVIAGFVAVAVSTQAGLYRLQNSKTFRNLSRCCVKRQAHRHTDQGCLCDATLKLWLSKVKRGVVLK